MPNAENNQKALTSVKNIKDGFATSPDDLYRQKPFFGTLFRYVNGQKVYLQYVKESDRLKLNDWLEQKNITSGVFILDTENPQKQPVSIEFHIDKNPESAPVENPFLRAADLKNNLEKDSNNSLNLKSEYEAHVISMKRRNEELEDKLRRTQDELYKLKNETADQTGKLSLEHQKELRKLEKDYEERVRDLEKQISTLEMDKRIDELEYKNSDRGGMTRLLDFVEEHGTEFIAGVIEQLNKANPNNPANATPKQIQAAIAQQKEQELTTNQSTSTPDQPTPEEHTDHKQQQMEVKQKIKANILDNAIKVITNSDISIQEYANFVRAQIAIMEQNNMAFDTQSWVEMAHALAEKAVDDSISAERVADAIRPLLDSVKGYAFMLKAVSPDKATEMLFNQFNVEANAEIKKLVSKVLEIIQKTI